MKLKDELKEILEEIHNDITTLAPNISTSLRQRAVDLRSSLDEIGSAIHDSIASQLNRLHKCEDLSQEIGAVDKWLELIEARLTELCEMKSDSGKLLLTESQVGLPFLPFQVHWFAFSLINPSPISENRRRLPNKSRDDRRHCPKSR